LARAFASGPRQSLTSVGGQYWSSTSSQRPLAPSSRIATGTTRPPRRTSTVTSASPGTCSWATTRTRLPRGTAGPPERRRRADSLGQRAKWQRCSSWSGGAQPGLDLADSQRELGPGLGGGAEPLAGSGAEGVALALLIGVELGGDGDRNQGRERQAERSGDFTDTPPF
jgi:hypothetical protein